MEVTVWNEYRHEREDDHVAGVYPHGIHAAIAEGLEGAGHAVRTRTLDDPDHGVDRATLDETDVLVWWSHAANDELSEAAADRVVEAVREGTGLIVLHSAKNSKPFRRLMGTSTDVKYRESGERERLWVVDPGHPIADGLEECVELPATEMYGEPFDVPEPDRLVFNSWFEGGEVFRSGCCYRRGRGRLFYFRPGHEDYPIYRDESVRTVLANAVEWAGPTEGATATYGAVPSNEPIDREPEGSSNDER
jgi:trehalose utilization protein